MARAILALLLFLVGCADHDLLRQPPPYAVYLVDVPADDLGAWEAAVDGWNAVVGSDVLTLHSGNPPPDRLVVAVYAVSDLDGQLGNYRRIEGHVTVRYLLGGAKCTAAHELGHVLGLPDEDEDVSVMAGVGCTFSLPSLANGAAVRERWGL